MLLSLRSLKQISSPLKTLTRAFPLRHASSTMNYDDILSDISRRREPSVLRELTSLLLSSPKDTISFATGMPNPTTFPFQDISVTLKDGTNIKIEGKELEGALQYQPSSGYTPLKLLLQEMQSKVHGPLDWTKTGILISSGSNDGISKAVDMLLNIGDPIIMQQPVYSGILNLLNPYLPQYILAEQDKDGMNPQTLRKTLEVLRRKGEKMPKVMYINPTGGNPTGTNLTNDRKRELYKLAQDYDFIILEDDAYFFLHFLDTEPMSMLSLDTDGRVLRFDSFSKILSSGLRLGIVTGPQELVRKIELHVQASILQTSSVAQVLAYKLLKSWGDEALQNHFKSIQAFYKRRRDIMVQAADKHLKGLAEWIEPQGGMFLWLKINGVPDTYTMVMKRGIEKHIMLVPGSCFYTDPNQRSSYVRAAFSLASVEEIDEGMSRLASLIKEEQRISCSEADAKH